MIKNEVVAKHKEKTLKGRYLFSYICRRHMISLKAVYVENRIVMSYQLQTYTLNEAPRGSVSNTLRFITREEVI